MNRKMLLASAFAVCAVFSAPAQEGNLIKSGDFENLPPANETKIKQFQAKGIEINRDPVVLIPGWFNKKENPPKITLIEAKAADDVKSGRYGLKVEAANAHLYTADSFQPGTYELSFFCKGNGKIFVHTYLYGQNGKYLGNGNTGLIVSPVKTWKKYAKTVKIGFGKENVAKVRLAFVFVKASVTLDDISLIPVKETGAKK